MRTRSRRVVLLLGAVAVLLPLLATPPALSAGPAETDGQAAALPAIKSTILKLTGYADTTVALGLRDNQFWVTIENSRLNDSTARQREAQAARIASTIANKVKGDATFAGILGIHIDYVARTKDGSHSDILDSIDFRKGPDGSFTHHTT